MKYFIIIFAALLFATSCDKKIEEKTFDKADGAEVENNQSETFKEPMPHEKLKELLPGGIAGLEKLPYNFGKSHYDEYYWTIVTAEYVGDGSAISYTISDHGTNGYIPYIKQYKHGVSDQGGKVASAVKFPGAVGYKLWNAGSGVGEINLMIGERFVLKVEIFKLPEFISSPEETLTFVDIEKMIKIATTK